VRCQWAGANQSVYLEWRAKGIRFLLDTKLVGLYLQPSDFRLQVLRFGVKDRLLIDISFRNLTVKIAEGSESVRLALDLMYSQGKGAPRTSHEFNALTSKRSTTHESRPPACTQKHTNKFVIPKTFGEIKNSTFGYNTDIIRE
jgi:hypothetical protein